ncbi:MAG: acetyl-CoA carboxylase biotin carboxyl carrier protein [Gammaproteobacteria bacterium]|nr:acetyl-CoA carboxylase biotin carboxyl carrier protein [Gammaproteobacteria bacterium]
MDLRKIKKLIELLEDSALVEMEITEGENTIRLSRAAPMGATMTSLSPQPTMMPSAGDPPVESASSPQPNGETVTSPMVGTFYGSSSPESAPYVSVGSVVKVGDVLGIIEAMKTFNQLQSEVAGTVRVIHKQPGDPVEFGEPLFLIEP